MQIPTENRNKIGDMLLSIFSLHVVETTGTYRRDFLDRDSSKTHPSFLSEHVGWNEHTLNVEGKIRGDGSILSLKVCES